MVRSLMTTCPCPAPATRAADHKRPPAPAQQHDTTNVGTCWPTQPPWCESCVPLPTRLPHQCVIYYLRYPGVMPKHPTRGQRTGQEAPKVLHKTPYSARRAPSGLISTSNIPASNSRQPSGIADLPGAPQMPSSQRKGACPAAMNPKRNFHVGCRYQS